MIRNLTIVKDDTKHYLCTFTDDAGSAVDISTWTVTMTVKKDLDDIDADAVIQKTKVPGEHDDPTNGKTIIKLTSADTHLTECNYYYDMEFKTGSLDKVTFLSGYLTVTTQITES